MGIRGQNSEFPLTLESTESQSAEAAQSQDPAIVTKLSSKLQEFHERKQEEEAARKKRHASGVAGNVTGRPKAKRCKFFAKGNCRFGDQSCRFSHDV